MTGKLKRVRRTGIKSTGRPKIPDDQKTKYVKMTMQLPEEMHAQLLAAAKATQRTKTGFIVYALERAIKGDK